MRSLSVPKNIIVLLAAMFLFAVSFILLSPKAEARTITASYIESPYSYCGDPHTYYDVFAPGANVTVSEGTSSVDVTFYGRIHVCSGVNYEAASYAQMNFRNINSRLSGMGSTWYFGSNTIYGPIVQRGNIYTQSRNVNVNTAGLGAGSHDICFEWQGSAWHGFWDYTNGWFQNCVTVNVTAPPPPQLGKIVVTKYGPDNSAVESCINFIFSNLACTGNSNQVTKDNLAITDYNVGNTPDAGWKISKIHINQYNSSGARILNEDRAGPNLNPVPLVAGGTTFVDVYYERTQGTFRIVKYPQRGASDANLTAHGKNSSDNTLFSVGVNENTDGRVVNVGSTYKAQFQPNTGYRVTRVRVNRETGSGITTVCDNCSISNNRTTWVDVFYEPDIRGSLDIVCPKPNQNETPIDKNGKIGGWVIDYYYPQQLNNSAVTPSQVRIRITEKNAGGELIAGTEQNYTVTANQDRPDLPIYTSNPQVGRYHGFSFDVPLQYFDGKKYDVKVFPLRNNSGIANPPSIYTLGQREMDCGGPRGSLDVTDCTVDNSKGKIAGWGFDPRRPGQAPNLHFYFDSTPADTTSDPDAIYNRNNVVGNTLRPDVVNSLRQNGYPGVLDATKYGFDEPFPDGLHDGESHVVRVYLITESGANPLIGSAGIGGGNNSALVCEAWYHPWLQTQNGDVTASGKIIGQGSGTDLLGSRPPANNEKEAEYLILSVLGGGDRFCSTYRYILTNTDALGGSCANGSGYTSLNRYELTPEPGKDAVVEAITKAFNDNGAGVGGANDKCAPYNTFTALPASPIDTVTGTSNNCLNGTIYKLPASAPTGNFGGFNILAGRMTIFIDGPLNITNDIKYNYISYANPKAVPNLAIIVKGDVNIGPNVTQLDAAVYATGKINTCTGYNPGTPTSSSACNNRLVVNGMLVGKEGFSFGRSYYNQSARNSAEFISLTGQTIAFPPPGLDSSYFGDFDNSVQIDSGEFQPRF